MLSFYCFKGPNKPKPLFLLLRYDFHGQCDLVYLENPEFGAGLGLSVHIRTTPRYEYSYIEAVAIQIGDDLLEVGSWGESFYNGVGNSGGEDVDMPNHQMADRYSVTHTMATKKRHIFEVDLLNGQKIIVTTHKDMVNVKMDGAKHGEFKNSVGLLGKFGTGLLLGRNGTDMEDDHDSFGQDWQVQSDEPRLFQTTRQPQHPLQCVMPSARKSLESRRRLGEGIAENAANTACEHWGARKEQCVFDVMAMGDLEYAEHIPGEL